MFGYRKYNTILYYVIYFANRKITLRATRHAGGVTRLLALLWLRQEFPEAGASGYGREPAGDMSRILLSVS
jgi:hypothetical protein